MPKWTRREALQRLGAATVAATVGCTSDDAPDSEPSPLDGWDLVRSKIDTVVVLIMENRSFDHVFGSLTLDEGRDDIDGLTADMFNPAVDGSKVEVFHTDVDCLHDPPHSWDSCHAQWNNGANDGFVTEFARRTATEAHEAMGYLNRTDQPASYALADHFTLCDAWFSSLMTSTQPNRFYFHCGHNDGVTNNDVPVGKDFPSIYTKVAEKGLTWGCYFSNAPGIVLVPDRKVSDHQLALIDQFFTDADNGDLPNLVLVEPAYGRNDDHPPAHPMAGQIFIAQIYEALANSPQWDRIAFFVTYDEHGGFFDHVPPPTAPDAFADLGFGQLGFRVPGLVIGPWAKPGHVDHTVYDHTSMLAFIETLFGIDPLSERDAAADPMLGAFDLSAMKAGTPLQPVSLDPIEADDSVLFRPECVTDGNDLRGMPDDYEEEEPGSPQEVFDYILAHDTTGRLNHIDDDTVLERLFDRAVARGVVREPGSRNGG